jgi:phosphoribosylformylglycinamidine cyclo-ligase
MCALSYEQSGVNYDVLDSFKRACQRAAASTVGSLAAHGLTEPPAVRGESAYLLETPTEYLAHVEEGLGTKNLVADAMLKLTGRSFYRQIGIDTVATIVNDLVTCGALPISVAMHAAVGDAKWFERVETARDLADGFAEGCLQANAVWGGGETPALKGIVEPSAIVLAGSALGRIAPKSNRIAGDVRDGDAIVFREPESTQRPHALPCARRPPAEGCGRRSPAAGRSARRSSLRRSFTCGSSPRQKAGLKLHYAAHDGPRLEEAHALDEPFVYRIRRCVALADLPIPHGRRAARREAYATFNMGAGFAGVRRPRRRRARIALARGCGHGA